VWNLATGENIFEFASVHDNSPISAIDIDPTGRRLLTAAQNGEIKMWNYNNGHCLLKLDKGNNYEVTDIKFVSVNQLKYVIAVGWDRKLSVFFDSFEPGNVYTSITPVDGWKMSSGHSDDMTCVVQCTPTTLATASYDGEIIMWNILSGQITRRFKAPLNNNQLKSISPKKGDCLIRRLIYLDKRSKLTGAASLIASGPGGYVHFWNIYNTKTPMGLFQAVS
jgi:WD40 repeat protein